MLDPGTRPANPGYYLASSYAAAPCWAGADVRIR